MVDAVDEVPARHNTQLQSSYVGLVVMLQLDCVRGRQLHSRLSLDLYYQRM